MQKEITLFLIDWITEYVDWITEYANIASLFLASHKNTEL